MSDQTAINFPITATDNTAKGAKSAEKRLSAIPKHVSAVNRRAADADERTAQKSSRGILRTFSAVEQASARAFGGRSVTAGLTSRLSALRDAGAAAGSGLGEAATAGGILSGTMGTLGVVAAGTVGVIAAAAYGAFKLADGWSKGAASIGRLASLLGVSTKALQEFTAAGERVGVDQAAGAGAMASLSGSLNDAKYGRNNEARAMLNYLGIGMKSKKDGTADTEAMLPEIADAIARQNSAGRRTVAKAFGISDAALPMFSQGGGALKKDMADAGKNAPIITDADVTVGQRMQRRHAMVAQKVERETMQRAGRAAAGGLDGAETWAVQQFSGSVSRDFAPGAQKIDRAAGQMERAAGRIERASGVPRAAGRFSSGQVASLARRATPIKQEARRYGFSEAEAAGIAANIILESGGRHDANEMGGGSGRGLIQWTDKARKAKFRQVMGVDVEGSSRNQQWRFLRWETQNSEARGWKKALAGGQDPGAIAGG
ncbi:MAG: phage tail tip lysozyme, partial [Pseudomonadota bacterium]|nr:phage tail tip lysozyme [Pseudomonadota bacterium]